MYFSNVTDPGIFGSFSLRPLSPSVLVTIPLLVTLFTMESLLALFVDMLDHSLLFGLSVLSVHAVHFWFTMLVHFLFLRGLCFDFREQRSDWLSGRNHATRHYSEQPINVQNSV